MEEEEEDEDEARDEERKMEEDWKEEMLALHFSQGEQRVRRR